MKLASTPTFRKYQPIRKLSNYMKYISIKNKQLQVTNLTYFRFLIKSGLNSIFNFFNVISVFF